MLNAQTTEAANTSENEAIQATGQAHQPNTKLETAIHHVGNRIGELSVNIAGMSGTVSDVSSDLSDQVQAFGSISDSVGQISNTNTEIATVLKGAQEIASSVHAGLNDSSGMVERIFTNSSSDMGKIADASDAVVSELEGVNTNIAQVHSFSESIQKIAAETQMLAINAGIMAARAGDEGKGFAIIADSIRELAQQTDSVSKDINRQLHSLKKIVNNLLKYGETNNQVALDARDRTEKMSDELQKFRQFSAQVDTLTSSISDISSPVEQNVEICKHVFDQMRDLNQEANANTARLTETSKQFESIVSFTEEMIRLVEESGVETEDTPLIKKCIEVTNQISQLFETAMDENQFTMNALFDESYQPIPNTDPQQFITKFTGFTDTVMPGIQEPFLKVDPRIAFCAAVDRNGYLPTHNNEYSQPQSPDPVWNAANCRNRRIFDDRTGLAAGRNTKPFLLQTYRRDMGGGKFTLMKDLSAPIFVKGRHWGGFRIGFRIG